MKRRKFIKYTGGAGLLCLLSPQLIKAFTDADFSTLEDSFINPNKSVGPWVVWHWTAANQTREGITSNLEGMTEVGIAGATLFSFPTGFGSGGGTYIENPAEPLTPEWFELIEFAVSEAGRLGIDLAIQISAGWATAGGSWIPPELSQQQIVWSSQIVEGGKSFNGILERPKRPESHQSGFGAPQKIPESWDNYYRDLNVLAFQEPADWGQTNLTQNARVTSDLQIIDEQKLIDPENTKIILKTEEKGYIQFEFECPFTLRSVKIHSGATGGFGGSKFNIPAHSLEVQASNDGISFEKIGNLEPMMGGWQTDAAELTHTVQQKTAKYFRLIHHPTSPVNFDESMHLGTYIGSGSAVDLKEKIDPLTIASITLSSTSIVHHWQGKTALAWGRSRRITDEEMLRDACIPLESIIDLSDKMEEDGTINWKMPEGKWKIMRFGYTTMAETNGSGVGQGLEADKFSREGARVAFEGWYEKILEHVGPKLSEEVIKMLNIDSWECGSQNWSPVFRDEFKTRRGYKVDKYLPLMAGIPIESATVTESFLYDIRRTIADLISDNFYSELQQLVHEKGDLINTEVTSPTMTSDGIMVYKNVDATSSEFWCDRWNCWKPHDIRDAVSGAHVYGKQIVIAEAYTGGGDWKEHPYDLKAMGDMHFVDGVNRMMIHLWAGQPYPGKVPGATGATGLYFNEHTTWIKPGRAWIDYMRRTQSMLQSGIPVADALYFIGEDIPARALIPPRYGSYFVTDPPLPEGYNYDSINQDALLNLASVENGKIVLQNGVSYSVLVLHPETMITPRLAVKIKELVQNGANIVGAKPTGSITLEEGDAANIEVLSIAQEIWGNLDGLSKTEIKFGDGRVFWRLSMQEVFNRIGLKPDVQFIEQKESISGKPFVATAYQPDGLNATAYGAERKGWGLMWNHRKNQGEDFYFLSNQEQMRISTKINIRQTGRIPEFWYPDTGITEDVPVWWEENGRTIIPYVFQPAGSVFVMFRRSSKRGSNIVKIRGKRNLNLKAKGSKLEKWAIENGEWILTTNTGKNINVYANDVPPPQEIEGDWDVTFPLLTGEVKHLKLRPGSWTDASDEEIRYFSGTATYKRNIALKKEQLDKNQRLFLDLGDVKNLCELKINGKDLGVIWKPPYVIEITDVVIEGLNPVEIEVTNTWYNRLAKDQELPKDKRQTWVKTGFGGVGIKAGSDPLLAGLIGSVSINTWLKV